MTRRAAQTVATAISLGVAGLGLSACGSGGGGSSDGSRVKVVATTTQLGDLVRNVGGNAVDVHQILQPNTDPHEYEPRPKDLVETSGAKVVFESGDNLDRWMADVVRQSDGDATTVDLGTKAPDRLPGETSGDEASRFDPHWWHDPRNVEAAIPAIRDALVAANPSARATYTRNAATYLAKVRRLDAGIQRCMDAVPVAQRNLVTSHDAFNYFAKRYDIDVVGAVIPSQTTQAQPSAASVQRLAAQVRRFRVKAIFPESSVNAKLADALAKETGARADLTLYGDTLGPKGSRGATYLGMEQANADAMIEGFTGSGGCRIAGL